MREQDEARQEGSEDAPPTAWVGPLLLMTALFYLNFTSRIVMAPLMPKIVEDLGVSRAGAGILFFLISTGYFISLAGAGLVSARLTHRRTIVLSAVAVSLALAWIAFARDLWTVRLGMLFLGLAAGLYLPSGIVTLTTLIESRHWGRAIAVHEMAPNLGFVTAPFLTEALIVWLDWRWVLLILAMVSAAMAAVFALFGQGGRTAGVPPTLGAFKDLARQPGFWIMIALFSLGITGSLGIYTMLPLYLVTGHGLERNWANTLIGLSRIPGLGMAFAAGWACDRWGPNKTLTGVFLFTGALTLLLGLLPLPWLYGAVFLQPVLAVCFFPAGFAVLALTSSPRLRSVAVSMTVPAGFVIGGGLVPTWIGSMADRGAFALGMSGTGALILAAALLPRMLRTDRYSPTAGA